MINQHKKEGALAVIGGGNYSSKNNGKAFEEKAL